MTTTRSLQALLATALLAVAPAARAHVISDNLDQQAADSEIASPVKWIAAGFETDLETYSLTSVTLSLEATSGVEGAVVQLYGSTGSGPGQPGTLLATLAHPGSLSGSEATFLADGVPLEPGTQYWVVLHTQPSMPVVRWNYTFSDDGQGDGFNHTWGYSENAGTDWTTFDSQPQIMSVSAEPLPWTWLGSGLAGVAGTPVLDGDGTLVAGSSGYFSLTQAAPAAPVLLFVSTSSTPTPFKGGTLLTLPMTATAIVGTNLLGFVVLPWTAWPAGLSGTTLFFQAAVLDAAAVKGVALSNALSAAVP